MAVQYVNRQGDTYYLHHGKTKSGMPKWFFATKTGDDLAESIPEGYESYEIANATVCLRKIVTCIHPSPIGSLTIQQRWHAFRKRALIPAAAGNRWLVCAGSGNSTFMRSWRRFCVAGMPTSRATAGASVADSR